jgi:hypothetical protein
VYKSKYFAAKRQPLRIHKFLVIASPEQISKTMMLEMLEFYAVLGAKKSKDLSYGRFHL